MQRSLALIALLCTLPLLLVSFALSLHNDVLNFVTIPVWQKDVDDAESLLNGERSSGTGQHTYAPSTLTDSYVLTGTTVTRTSTLERTATVTLASSRATTNTVSYSVTYTYTFAPGLISNFFGPGSVDFSGARFTPPISTAQCFLPNRCGDLTTMATPTAAAKRAVKAQITAAPIVRRATSDPQTAAALLAYLRKRFNELRATTAVFFISTLSCFALIVAVVVFVVLFRGRHQSAQGRVEHHHSNPSNPTVKDDAELAVNRRTRTLTTFTIVIAVFTTTYFLFGLVGFILFAVFFGTGPLPPSYSAEIAFWTLCVLMLIASLVALGMDRRASAQQEREIGNSSGGSFDSDNDPSQIKEEPQATTMITQGFDSPQQAHQHNSNVEAASVPIQPVSPHLLQAMYSYAHPPGRTLYESVPDGKGGTVLQQISQA